MKRKNVQKLKWDGSVLTATYPSIGKSLSIDVSKLAQSVQDAARFHGFKQAAGDSKSGDEPQAKYEMCSRRFAAWRSGSWTLEDRQIDPARVLEAIAELKKVPVARVQAEYDKLDDQEEFIETARNLPDVKAKMLELAAKKLTATVDKKQTADVLSKLNLTA